MPQQKKASPAKKDTDGLTDILKGISGQLSEQGERSKKIEDRLNKIEEDKLDFKSEVNEEDIKNATRLNIPKKICEIVDETLGQDFNVKMEGNKDRPGFMLKIIVPTRLSLLSKRTRPIKKESGGYKKDSEGNNVMEEYQPDDNRAIQLSTIDSYERIREFCEKVRQNLVLTYENMKRPLPPLNTVK